MRKSLLLMFALLLGFDAAIQGQEATADREKEAVKRVVETYLYAEEGEERKRTIYPPTKILSLNHDGSQVTETPISKPSKKRKGAREKSRQKIVSIDMTEGAASVKVETDLASDDLKIPKHIHYLSLLKVAGEWKIVSILMPPVRMPQATVK